MNLNRLNAVSGWGLIFLINFSFQLYRGFDPDLFYFGFALALVILESAGLLNWIPEFRKVRRLVIFIVPIIGIAILFIKRESAEGRYLFYFLFVAMFVALWRRGDGDKNKLTQHEVSLAKSIGAILIAICSWEVLMFTLARIFDDSPGYPTLSELIVPHLDGYTGRSIFIVLWVALGIFIIRDWDET